MVLFQFACSLNCFSSFTSLHLPISPSTSISSLVHPLHFALSCSTVLLKLPRWPLYLQHWSAHTFFCRKVFWAVNRCAGTCKTHSNTGIDTHWNYYTAKCSIIYNYRRTIKHSMYRHCLQVHESVLPCNHRHMNNICVYILQIFLHSHQVLSPQTHPDTMNSKSNNNVLWRIRLIFDYFFYMQPKSDLSCPAWNPILPNQI